MLVASKSDVTCSQKSKPLLAEEQAGNIVVQANRSTDINILDRQLEDAKYAAAVPLLEATRREYRHHDDWFDAGYKIVKDVAHKLFESKNDRTYFTRQLIFQGAFPVGA
jgi:hypothetical protein